MKTSFTEEIEDLNIITDLKRNYFVDLMLCCKKCELSHSKCPDSPHPHSLMSLHHEVSAISSIEIISFTMAYTVRPEADFMLSLLLMFFLCVVTV